MISVDSLLKMRPDHTMPYVDLSYHIYGQTLPSDHGYGLYSAIAHACPAIHDREGISIQTIAGKPDKQGKIYLSSQSRLNIRLPYKPEQIAYVLSLAGQTLKIGIHEIQLGIPEILPLRPVGKLRSRIVTIKNFQDVGSFQKAAQRQLDTLEIHGNLSIPLNERGEPSRKVIKIKRYSVVGFSAIVTDLNEEDSIKLQIFGLGGKRRMGCGIFTVFPYAWRL